MNWSALEDISDDWQFRILMIVLLGLLLRLVGLGSEAYWNDEGITIWYIRKYNPIELIYEIPLSQPHPPLYYVFLDLWTFIVGFDEFLVRVPSALFGAITIFVVYLLTKHLFNEETALLAAFLIAISPFHIRISQFARMYALLGMLTAISYYSLLSMRSDISRPNLVMYSVSTVLLLLTHFYGLYVLISQVLYVLHRLPRGERIHWKTRERSLWSVPIVLLTFVLGLLLLVKLLYLPLQLEDYLGAFSVTTARQGMSPSKSVSPAWILQTTLVGTSLKGGFILYTSSIRPDFLSPWFSVLVEQGHILIYIITGLLIGMWLYTKEGKKNSTHLLLIWMAVPFLIVIFTGIIGVQYRPRYLVVAAIPFFILVARSLYVIQSECLQSLLTMGMVVLLLVQVGAMYSDTSVPNYGTAADFLDGRADEQDVVLVVYYKGGSKFELKPAGFYFRDSDFEVVDMAVSEGGSPTIQDSIQQNRDTIWVVTPVKYVDKNADIERSLRDTDYRLTERFISNRILVYKYNLGT